MEEHNAPDDFNVYQQPKITMYPCLFNPDMIEEVPCIYCKGFKHGSCTVLNECNANKFYEGE